MREQERTKCVHPADATNSGGIVMSTFDRNPNPQGTSSTGWIVGAVVVVLVIIGLFYWGGSTTNTASNTSTPPATSSTTGSGADSAMPRATTPPRPATPAPSAPSATPPAGNSN
jgi:hypothetical protein